jgi:hypothetical protein
MRKDTIAGLLIIFTWFIFGIFSKLPDDVFWTGLIAFVLGGFLIKWGNELDEK